MEIPSNHLVPLVGDQEAGNSVFTSDKERRGRLVKTVAVVGEVKVGIVRATDAVEGQLPISWEETHVPLSEERLDMLIESLQVARLQAFGTPLT